MAQNPNSVNDRLQQASQGGSPKLDPDQQRKFLGTFRERVSLAIPVTDASDPKAFKALSLDVKKHPNYILIVNGALLSTDISIKYEKLAMDNNISFTTEDEKTYGNPNLSFGIIFANKSQAINQYPIDWYHKYSKLFDSSKVQTFHRDHEPKKESLWSKIKELF